MTELYTRVGSASIIKEVTANVALTPTTFLQINEEDIAIEYAHVASMPIASNRSKNIRSVKNKIMPASGAITMNVEPKQWGHILNAVYGGLTTGRYLSISSASAAFTVGETITGGTSAATGVVAIDADSQILVLTSPVGTFTAGETVTGGTSASTAVVGLYNASAYAHVGTMPKNSLTTYTLQINYSENAIRYMGTRFHGIEMSQEDNIMTASVKVMSQSAFRHAKVTAITSSGAGAKTLTMDQTLGLVAGDSIKLYRPSTGVFQDFSAASTKTHTVATVASTTTITVTNLQTATAVGDLIMLAPQTASFTIGNEYVWIGGATGQVGAAIASLATQAMEDFNLTVESEMEERHSAQGSVFKDRFATALLLKGLTAEGSFTAFYNDEDFYALLRSDTAQALRIKSSGDQIGTSGIYNEIQFTLPETHFDPYQTNLSQDEIMNEEVPFQGFYNTTAGYFTRAILVNDVTAY